MTSHLPPDLMAFFAPRDPIPYLPPPDELSHEKHRVAYTPIGSYVKFFEDPTDAPPPVRTATKEEKAEQKRQEKQEQNSYKLEQEIALWKPQHAGEPFKTLFVGRIHYETTESKLRREFEAYGTVKKISLVCDVKTGKPRGYGFIEYKHERDMRAASKHADGKKIDGRRVVVDVVRGGTVDGWLPRRLGGGLGDTRRARSVDDLEEERGERTRGRSNGREESGRRERRRSHERAESAGRRNRPNHERASENRRKRSRSREGDRKRRRSRSPGRNKRDRKR